MVFVMWAIRPKGETYDITNEYGKQKVIIKELCDGDLPKEANVPQVPAKDKTPMIDEANDQTQLAGYMSLILFDKVPTQVSPQYRRNGRVNSIVGQSSCAKKLCLVELDDVVEDQGGDHAKLDDVVQDQGGENPKLDDVVQDQAGEHANMNDVVQDQEVEHANMDDVVQDQGGDHDNFDYDEFHYENFSHDHFDPFDGEHYQPPEDENVEDHQSEHEKSADSDDLRQQSEEQYDELVDDENNVSEVEVDMTDFNLNLDKDYGCVQMDGFHNGVGTNDEHEDIEVIDNDRWDSLDEGSEDERKRRCVLKNLAKEKRCSLGNVHKASFYVGQKFKSKKELKEKIDMHALETRRNLYYKKNDKLRLRALCRGVVPVINASGVVGLNPKNKTKGKEPASGVEFPISGINGYNLTSRYCQTHPHHLFVSSGIGGSKSYVSPRNTHSTVESTPIVKENAYTKVTACSNQVTLCAAVWK
ncbi:unnamed protein product [Lactuca saligna]|uniref:Uncharacterized protein n=1 Tax=Lactuca saligna TaxID=75948 RepID=A0AA35VYE2_LACSI|nr:unnamed protein product [Lactuca saligna]